MKKLGVNIKKWLCSTAGKLSCVLLLVSAVLIVIGASNWGSLCERTANIVNNLLFGLATNLLGIIVTVAFVQFFLDRQANKEEKKNETERILRFDRIMSVILQYYTIRFNRLTTPLDEPDRINSISSAVLNSGFVFSDLKDLYGPSLLIKDQFSHTAISGFYECESELRNCCASIIKEIEFKFYPDLCSILLEIVQVSLSLDVRNTILGNHENPDYQKMMVSRIADTSHNWVKLIETDSNYRSNAMFPYVTLYELLKNEAALITQYQEQIAQIKEAATRGK